MMTLKDLTWRGVDNFFIPSEYRMLLEPSLNSFRPRKKSLMYGPLGCETFYLD